MDTAASDVFNKRVMCPRNRGPGRASRIVSIRLTAPLCHLADLQNVAWDRFYWLFPHCFAAAYCRNSVRTLAGLLDILTGISRGFHQRLQFNAGTEAPSRPRPSTSKLLPRRRFLSTTYLKRV